VRKYTLDTVENKIVLVSTKALTLQNDKIQGSITLSYIQSTTQIRFLGVKKTYFYEQSQKRYTILIKCEYF